MKINFLKKEKTFKKKNFGFNSNLYWMIAILGAVVILLPSFFFAYNLFMQINQEYVLPPANSGGAIPTVDKDHIEKVLNYFSLREAKSNQILISPAPVVDPTL